MKDKKYVVIEVNDSFVVCHGSGLTWAEAHLFVLSQMYEDASCSGKDSCLERVKLFELEANEPGLGVTYTWNGNNTTYYILDDPGVVIGR